MKIGLVGLGRMGGGMARRLLAHGYDLKVFDRDSRQTGPLAPLGAHVAGDLAQVCDQRELVITMLPSDDILEAVTLGPLGLVASLPADAIHMVSGTHGVVVVREADLRP